MTIKQHGGIFGRNPTFNTIGGTLTTAAQPNITSLGTQTSNLAFASGNGIDFSATAGTGTSELLDDYEEGQWTPGYAPATNSFDAISYNIQNGSYTKVGRVVHCVCSLRTSSITVGTASGDIYLTGLPFTHSSAVNQQGYWATAVHTGFVNAPSNIKTKTNDTKVEIQKGNNNANLAVADLTTASTGNFLAVSFSYIAAA